MTSETTFVVDAKLKELADEYWALQDSLRTSPKKDNRRHREVYTRQLEVCKAVCDLRPGEHPLVVIEQVSGRRHDE